MKKPEECYGVNFCMDEEKNLLLLTEPLYIDGEVAGSRTIPIMTKEAFLECMREWVVNTMIKL